MSYAPTAHCDVCDEPRRQTNNWFQARLYDNRIVIEPFDPKSTRIKHLCGEGCVGKFVSTVLAGLHATETPIEFPILDQQQSPP